MTDREILLAMLSRARIPHTEGRRTGRPGHLQPGHVVVTTDDLVTVLEFHEDGSLWRLDTVTRDAHEFVEAAVNKVQDQIDAGDPETLRYLDEQDARRAEIGPEAMRKEIIAELRRVGAAMRRHKPRRPR